MGEFQLDSIYAPNVIQIEHNLWIVKFELMKIIPAKYMLEQAIKANILDPTKPVVETSSGTFALGLGLICSKLGIPFHIISDSIICGTVAERLRKLGGEVQILPDIITGNQPQTLRLEYLEQYLKDCPAAYWPSQYHNPNNQKAYAAFADFLVERLGIDFTLVAAVGSGGSACGTIKRAREFNKKIKLVGVDTHGSILFGLPNKKRVLRGLGNSILPKNLDHTCFDQVHWVSANDAFAYARFLFEKKGLFCGATTGANYQVAKWLSENNPYEKFVFLSADTGERYVSTVFNTVWLDQHNLLHEPSFMPRKIEELSQINENWNYINWQRRTLEQMIGVVL